MATQYKNTSTGEIRTQGVGVYPVGTTPSGQTKYSDGSVGNSKWTPITTPAAPAPAAAPQTRAPAQAAPSSGAPSGAMTEDEALKAGIDVNQLRSKGLLLGGGGAGGLSIPAAPTLDLQGLYKQKYDESGITAEETALTAKQQEAADLKKKLAEAVTFNGDNPFISESVSQGRIGRKSKEADTKLGVIQEEANAIQGRIDRKKADVETSVNIATKQFDINSQQAQQALSNLNTYLGLGLLNGASDSDIAQLTRGTGISSAMITSAINAKKTKDVEPQLVTSTDNDGNLTIVAVDKATGKILSQNSVAGVGKAKGGSGSATEAEKKAYYMNALREDAAGGATLKKIFSTYQGTLEPNDIYALYNASSKFGPDKGDVEKLAKYGVKPIY